MVAVVVVVVRPFSLDLVVVVVERRRGSGMVGRPLSADLVVVVVERRHGSANGSQAPERGSCSDG